MDVQNINIQQLTELLNSLSWIKLGIIGILILGIIFLIKPVLKDILTFLKDVKKDKNE